MIKDGDYRTINGHGCTIKIDEHGYIIDPHNMNLKCGWGKSFDHAKRHFFDRNGLEYS